MVFVERILRVRVRMMSQERSSRKFQSTPLSRLITSLTFFFFIDELEEGCWQVQAALWYTQPPCSSQRKSIRDDDLIAMMMKPLLRPLYRRRSLHMTMGVKQKLPDGFSRHASLTKKKPQARDCFYKFIENTATVILQYHWRMLLKRVLHFRFFPIFFFSKKPSFSQVWYEKFISASTSTSGYQIDESKLFSSCELSM